MSWPRELIAVRHGQSVANAAFAAADAQGRAAVRVSGPDWAVPLSPLGRGQSARLGAYLAGRGRIDAIFTSTYERARETTALLRDELRRRSGAAPPAHGDERLRDREVGVLELMSLSMIERDLPDEMERRLQVGEFYYRPAGGESFPDVIVRVRSFLADLRERCSGQLVLVVAHDAIVLMLRYLLEGLTPEEVMAAGDVHNASVTRWVASGGTMALAEFDTVTHLADEPGHGSS